MSWRDDIKGHLDSVEDDFKRNGIVDIDEESLTKLRDDKNVRFLMRAYASFWLNAHQTLDAADRGDIDSALESMGRAYAALWKGQGEETSELGRLKHEELRKGGARKERSPLEVLGFWHTLAAYRGLGMTNDFGITNIPQSVWNYIDEIAFALTELINKPPLADYHSEAVMEALQFERGMFKEAQKWRRKFEVFSSWYDYRDQNPGLKGSEIDEFIALNFHVEVRTVQRWKKAVEDHNQAVLDRRRANFPLPYFPLGYRRD